MTTPIKIKATVMWANLDRVNELTGKYQVDLTDLSDAAVSKLTEMGIDVKNKEGMGNYITCKSINPIHPFSQEGMEMDGIAIGNGSKAIAVIGSYTWTFRNKEGVSPSLRKLIITDLVSYEEPDAVSIDDDDDIL
jgi:hypothetical protein